MALNLLLVYLSRLTKKNNQDLNGDCGDTFCDPMIELFVESMVAQN